jgi:hypothetical protein
MITGAVTVDRQAIIRMTVCGPAGQEHEIRVIKGYELTAQVQVAGHVIIRASSKTPSR